MLRTAALARRAAPRVLQTRRLQSNLPPASTGIGADAGRAEPPLIPPTPPAPAPAPPLTPPKPVATAPLPPPEPVPQPQPGPAPAPAQPSPTVPVAEPTPAAHSGKGPASRLRSLLLSSALFLGTSALLFYAYDTRAGIHRWLTLPAFLALTEDDPERGHEIAVKVLASGLGPVDLGKDDERLAFELWGKKFDNPVGIAAGFDKHAEAIDGLFNLGFGYVEVGSITPEPQPGNPKPRLFRVPESNSVVNRYGFNSEGHVPAVARLRARVRKFVQDYASVLPAELFSSTPLTNASAGEYDPVESYLASPVSSGAAPVDAVGLPRSLKQGKVLGLNLGKNKVSDPDSIDDFVKGITALGPYADVVVINVSSPNTPGLRNLQRKGMLSELLEGVVHARDLLPTTVKPPVLVKVAPDLDDEQISDIAYAATHSGVDGVIVSNTTISRPASAGSSPMLKETGGLSGPPVKPLAIRALSALYEQTDGKLPLVGCGGISSGQDALDYAKAGASLVQLYTGFVYGGVGLPRRIKDELAELLKAEGKSWKEVIGQAHRERKAAAVAATAAQQKKVAEEKARASVVPPVPQAVLDVKDKADGLSEKPKEKEAGSFGQELKEAKSELEALLKELAEVEKPLPTSAAPAAAKAEPVAVPAPVAESIPSTPAAVSPITTPSPTPTPADSPNSSSFSAPPGPPSPPTIVTTAPPTPFEETPIGAPAQAVQTEKLLDQQAVRALLDPAAAQVKAGIAEGAATKEKVEERKQEKVEEKRWV
ncbi:hypothetical protein JCM8097_009392 [Rhodosporidiobolus ruineniae]